MLKLGVKLAIDGTEYKVVLVGKECKLEAKDGSAIWRHSRTVGRLLEQSKKPARSTKPRTRARKSAGTLADVTRQLAADTAQAKQTVKA